MKRLEEMFPLHSKHLYSERTIYTLSAGCLSSFHRKQFCFLEQGTSTSIMINSYSQDQNGTVSNIFQVYTRLGKDDFEGMSVLLNSNSVSQIPSVDFE